MKVVDPHGLRWRVRRRWLPWRRRTEPVGHGLGPTDLGDGPLGMMVWTVVLILAIPIVVVALVFALELLLLLLLLPFAVLGRVLFGRQWHVEVWMERGLVWEEDAGGWAESGRRIEEIAAQVRSGDFRARRRT